MLLVVTFLVAGACALYPYIFLPGIISLCVMGFVGVMAYRSERMVPLAQAMTAIFLSLLFPPAISNLNVRRVTMSDSDAIAFAIITGLGLYFSVKAIWKGEWATKILAFLIFMFFFGNAGYIVSEFINVILY